MNGWRYVGTYTVWETETEDGYGRRTTIIRNNIPTLLEARRVAWDATHGDDHVLHADVYLGDRYIGTYSWSEVDFNDF